MSDIRRHQSTNPKADENKYVYKQIRTYVYQTQSNMGEGLIEFNNENSRICTINGHKYIAVLDILMLVCSQDQKHASKTLSRMKDTYPEITPKMRSHQFSGRGQKSIEVTDLDNALNIILLLPGAGAKNFRKKAIESLKNVMRPTEEFIEEMTERMGLQRSTIPKSVLFQDETKIVTKSSRSYEDAYIYVRIRRPPEYLIDNNEGKMLTLQVIKFGIAFSINDRNNTYVEDNGFMAFSKHLNSRKEVEIIEDILKLQFKEIAVYDSREYVDAGKLAGILGFDEYQPNDYDSYILLAERLFCRMIELIEVVFKGKYNSMGRIYHPIEKLRGSTSKTSSKNEESKQMQLELKCDMETKNFHAITPLEVEFAKVQQQLIELQGKYDELKKKGKMMTPAEKAAGKITSDDKVDNRSDGKVISRDILTGEEKVYGSAEQAAYAAGYTPSAFKRTVLNARRQMAGKTWRSEGNPFWIPMKGLVFETNRREVSVRYIKAENITIPDDVKVYESITTAARIMDINRKTLTDHILKRKGLNNIYKGYRWSMLLDQDYGSWSNQVILASASLPAVTALTTEEKEGQDDEEEEEDGQNGRCNGKVIARNLKTGKEIVFPSTTKAGGKLNISAGSLRDNYINKPRQVRGYQVRTFKAKTRWQPPDYFLYDDTSFEAKSNGYIIAEKDGVREMYESIIAAVKLMIKNGVIGEGDENGARAGISRSMNYPDKKYAERIWRAATKEESDVFVAC